jgi:hypothetical protein
LVEFLRKFRETGLTDSKVAMIVVIDTVVANSSADSTDIADVVNIGDALEVVAVAYGTSLFGTRRYPT